MSNKSSSAGRKKSSHYPARRNKAEEKRKAKLEAKRRSRIDTIKHIKRIEKLMIMLEEMVEMSK